MNDDHLTPEELREIEAEEAVSEMVADEMKQIIHRIYSGMSQEDNGRLTVPDIHTYKVSDPNYEDYMSDLKAALQMHSYFSEPYQHDRFLQILRLRYKWQPEDDNV